MQSTYTATMFLLRLDLDWVQAKKSGNMLTSFISLILITNITNVRKNIYLPYYYTLHAI